jgi:uncharacterized membrane protein YciS (DUF1049 family)
MLRLINGLVLLLLFVFITSLAVINIETVVTVHFYLASKPINLVILLLVTLFIGCGLGILLNIHWWLKLRQGPYHTNNRV